MEQNETEWTRMRRNEMEWNRGKKQGPHCTGVKLTLVSAHIQMCRVCVNSVVLTFKCLLHS